MSFPRGLIALGERSQVPRYPLKPKRIRQYFSGFPCTRSGTFACDFLIFAPHIPEREHGAKMKKQETTTSRNASKMAQAFGSVIRSRRRALQMRQVDLALATGVGRRFLV